METYNMTLPDETYLVLLCLVVGNVKEFTK